MSKTEMVKTKEVTLDILKFAAVGVLPGQTMIDSLTYEKMWRAQLNEMLYEIRVKVLAHNFEQHTHTVTVPVTFDHPATWWQMFKRAHFPDWLLHRFPVQYVEETKNGKRAVTFKKYATYPSADIALPPQTFGFPVYRTTIEEGYSSDAQD